MNPIGIDSNFTVRNSAIANPIGIENRAEKHQSLSCVGITFPKQRIATYSVAVSSNPKDDGRTVEEDLDRPSFDHARVVIDEDGVIRERDHQPHQPDSYDMPTNLIH